MQRNTVMMLPFPITTHTRVPTLDDERRCQKKIETIEILRALYANNSHDRKAHYRVHSEQYSNRAAGKVATNNTMLYIRILRTSYT